MHMSKLAAACAFAIALTPAPAQAWEVTWLGQSGFVLTDKGGTTVLVDPWLRCPTFPRRYRLPVRVDAILITHGHFDHASSATELSRHYDAPIVGVGELTDALAPKEGPAGIGGNVGGTIRIGDLKVALIPAIHSSSMTDEDGVALYLGDPVGFVLSAPGERNLMHAGDSGLTAEYKTVRELYHPQIAMLPIGGTYTMDPYQASIAASYLGVLDVIPMHYGTFPTLRGTPAQLRAYAHSFRVDELTPGVMVQF